MEILLISGNNFHLDSLDSFSRYQVVETVYRPVNGTLQLFHNPFVEDWSPERRREKAREVLSGKYIVYGAVSNGNIVGQIMLLPELDHNRMIIDSFHVSADYRRHGIGRALFQAAKKEATERGAAALYVSACSAKETIDFYTAMGFVISSRPIMDYAEAEPFDIQMEYVL